MNDSNQAALSLAITQSNVSVYWLYARRGSHEGVKKLLKKSLAKCRDFALVLGFVAGGIYPNQEVNAALSANDLGDLAIIPYYTVRGNFITGVVITNRSRRTHVVKFRLRRSTDSADVLGFTLVMSPFDIWTGFISSDTAGGLTVTPTDNTCTAPLPINGVLTAPDRNLAAGDEGYIEIIAMGRTTNERQPIALAAEHVDGTPRNCQRVANNFLQRNVRRRDRTRAEDDEGIPRRSHYTNSGNVLKVSYFIRDTDSGMEFGNNAVHIANFANEAMISNQSSGLSTGDLNGFDFPDLDGSGDDEKTNNGRVSKLRGRYDTVIRADLGAASLLNDWSANPAIGVATDWVATVPGQYLMVNPAPPPPPPFTEPNHSDIPLNATIRIFDREEKNVGSGLSVSPGNGPGIAKLENEVNVIEWEGNSVFGAASPVTITGTGALFGWAELELATMTPVAEHAIFDLTDQTGGTYTGEVGGFEHPNNGAILNRNPPIIGFTAWQRTFADPDKNYGRMVKHSRKN